jgi:hypothetical protein
VWYADVVRQRRERRRAASAGPPHPAVPLLEEDVNYWVRQFGGAAALEKVIQEEQAPRPTDSPADPCAHGSSAPEDKPLPGILPELDNPFPPGYGEDVLREEGR